MTKPTSNKPSGPIETKQAASEEAVDLMKAQIADLQRQLDAEKLRNSPSATDIMNRQTLLRTSATEQRSKDPETGEPLFEEVEVMDRRGNPVFDTVEVDDGKGGKRKEKVQRMRKVELWDYRIDLAPAGRHDGAYMLVGETQYIHGLTYRVRTDVLQSLKEIISRGWQHEDEISGRRNVNEYRRPENRILRPSN